MSEQNQIIEYSVKSIAVIGDTKNIKDFMFNISLIYSWNYAKITPWIADDNIDIINEHLQRNHYEKMKLVEAWESKLTPEEQKLLLALFKYKITGKHDDDVCNSSMMSLIIISLKIEKKLTEDEWFDTKIFIMDLGNIGEVLKTRQ